MSQINQVTSPSSPTSRPFASASCKTSKPTPQSFSASNIANRSAVSASFRTVQASFKALIHNGADDAEDDDDDEEEDEEDEVRYAASIAARSNA